MNVWDASSGELLRSFEKPSTSFFTQFRWSPDGTRLAVPFWSQKLLILTRATLPTRHRQRPDPSQHVAEQPPVQIPLGQQQPVIGSSPVPIPARPAGGDKRDSPWQSRPHPQMPFLPSAALNARPFYPGNMGE